MSAISSVVRNCEVCNRAFSPQRIQVKLGRGFFCSHDCANQRRRRSEPEARFWSRVDKSGECWVWTGGRDEHGYGSFTLSTGNYLGAHRYSYTLAYGDPGDLRVCHTCDNPPRVNPEHLFAGTQLENIKDRVTKGRCAGGQLLGEENRHARLRALDVIEIVRMLRAGATQAAVAVAFGVSENCIGSIARGRNWSHVTGIPRYVDKNRRRATSGDPLR